MCADVQSSCTLDVSLVILNPGPKPRSSLKCAHLRVRVLGDALHGVRPGRQLLGADLVLVAPRAQAEVGALDALVVRADHLPTTDEARIKRHLVACVCPAIAVFLR